MKSNGSVGRIFQVRTGILVVELLIAESPLGKIKEMLLMDVCDLGACIVTDLKMNKQMFTNTYTWPPYHMDSI